MYREEIKMAGNKDFIIQVKGLPSGKHEYEFPINGSFFESFENSFIQDASLTAWVELEKGGGWMNLNCTIEGCVTVECDRCLEELELPVDFDATVAIKSAKTDDDPQDDGFIILDPTEGELDLRQFFYDYVCINLPLQKVHPEGECNPDMLKKLDQVQYGNQPETPAADSPFGALKGLLEKDKTKK